MNSFDTSTNNLIIRDINSQDFSNLKTVYNDKTVLKHLAKLPFSDDDIMLRHKDMLIYRQLNLQLTSAIIDKRNNKFMGFTRVDFYPSLDYLRQYGEVKGVINDLGPGGHFQSAYLLNEYQNKGHMTEVVSELRKHLAKNNIQYLFGSINNENAAARKLLDKFSFEYQYSAPVDLQRYGIPVSLTKFHDEYFAFGKTQ